MKFNGFVRPLLGAAAFIAMGGTALASDDVKEHVRVPAPPEGKAEVVFFRPGGLGGSAISCAVSENKTKISSLPPARFFILVAEPGEHVYTAASESKDEVFFDLKPGQIAYVKCSVAMGILVGRPKLEAAQDLEFTSKTWKSVTEDRISDAVLTDAEIATALAAQKAPAPVAQPASVAEPAPAAAPPEVVKAS